MTFLISFFKDWPNGPLTSPRFSRPRPHSAPEIDDCEIERLASSATDDGLDHVEGDALEHLTLRVSRRIDLLLYSSSWLSFSSNVLTLQLNLPQGTYKSWDSRTAHLNRILDSIQRTPGVIDAAGTLTAMPPNIGFNAGFEIPGRPVA